MKFDMDRTLADLRTLEADILAATRQVLGQASAFGAEHARQSTAFKDQSRALRGSIQRGSSGEWSMFVKAGGRGAPHAGFVESGTKPHPIRAKMGRGARGPVAPGQSRGANRSGLLTFKIAGRWISTPSVKHPGTKPTHFMLDARNAAEIAAARFIEAGMNSAIGR